MHAGCPKQRRCICFRIVSYRFVPFRIVAYCFVLFCIAAHWFVLLRIVSYCCVLFRIARCGCHLFCMHGASLSTAERRAGHRPVHDCAAPHHCPGRRRVSATTVIAADGCGPAALDDRSGVCVCGIAQRLGGPCMRRSVGVCVADHECVPWHVCRVQHPAAVLCSAGLHAYRGVSSLTSCWASM